MINIIGLGFGQKDAITLEAIDAIKNSSKVILRTKYHPTVEILDNMGIKYTTCDDLYDKAEDFESLYKSIAKRVIEESKNETVAYVVPGAPSILESTVNQLLKSNEEFNIIEAVSFIEPCITASKVDVGEGFLMIDAVDIKFSNINPNFNIMITQLWNEFIISDVKLKLQEIYDDETEITAIYSAGVKGEEIIKKVKLFEMDRELKADIRLSVVIESKKDLNILDILDRFDDISIEDAEKLEFSEDNELNNLLKSLINSYKGIKELVDEGFYEKIDVINVLKSAHFTDKF